MKPGDLVEWNWGVCRKRGMVIKKSNFFGWAIYFPTGRNKIDHLDHLNEKDLRKIQQLTEEK